MPAPKETGFFGRQALPPFMLLASPMSVTQIEGVPVFGPLRPSFSCLPYALALPVASSLLSGLPCPSLSGGGPFLCLSPYEKVYLHA